MAVDYYCELAANEDVDEIVRRVQTLIGGDIERDGRHVTVVTTAMVTYVKAISDPVRRQWSFEDWGVESRIMLSFYLDRSAPEDDYFAARRAFSLAAARLAEDLDTDAILRVEMDRLIFLRKDGTLTLYDWWPDWTDPQTVAALPAGYILASDRKDTPRTSPSADPS